MGEKLVITYKDEKFLNSDIPVVIHFGTPRCPGSKTLFPILEELAEKYFNGIHFGFINTTDSPALGRKYEDENHPNKIPKVALFKKGKLLTIVGEDNVLLVKTKLEACILKKFSPKGRLAYRRIKTNFTVVKIWFNHQAFRLAIQRLSDLGVLFRKDDCFTGKGQIKANAPLTSLGAIEQIPGFIKLKQF